jgi:hypothetical protein
MASAENEALTWGYKGIFCVADELNDSALRLYINQLSYQVVKANRRDKNGNCVVLFKCLQVD